ncbi:hypothetical protein YASMINEVIRUS_249 [Yasminevirus sp. GU-2018]|uniref:Uncharacterized protein n=1 Tax=Yasminevirus sp. GU-2018 TaxID=2420051 RepID=A0A5K0U9I1_9VIRU|nr:hypothetical protein YASMINEVIRUS_249 [Yasminevirus sp. GU-2018]
MSFVTSTGDIVPQIITKDLFPAVYALDVPINTVADYDVLGSYPGIYNTYGLPVGVTASVDPAYVTGPQKYEYRYTNQNGIDVVLRGTYDDVMSTVDTLNTYPPAKRDCTKTGDREYVELYGPGSKKSSTNVPSVGQISRGKQIYIKMDNKIFSGSGSLIMVLNEGRPTIEAKFVLFRDANSGKFEDLGGMIDKPAPGVVIDRDTIFNNAKKETEEESMKLFTINRPSPVFVDIESTTDNTFYRVYLYLFKMQDIAQLSNLYDHNKTQILTNFPHNYNDSYKETDKLALFDYQTFTKKLATYNTNSYSISSGVFQDTQGNLVNVRGRTMKVIAQFVTQNLLLDVINNNKINNATIATPMAPNTFNNIGL